MNCSLLLVLTIFVFPVDVFKHVAKVIEITNMTIKGNIQLRIKLCRIFQSFKSNNGILFHICFSQKSNALVDNELVCKSTKIIYNNFNCTKNILNQINSNATVSMHFGLNQEFQNKIFVTFRWDRLNSVFYSNNFGVNQSSPSIATSVFYVDMGLNVSAQVLLVHRLRCAPGYYGQDCDNFCEPADDIFGHYNCNNNGYQVCLAGWQGLFCTEAICHGCVNGRCLAPNNCKCYHGWIGSECDKCQKAIACKHGTCNNKIGLPFTCVCKVGWGGQNCDIDLRHCFIQRGLCENNGSCLNYYGDSQVHYICKCAPGYFGRHCKIKSGDCELSVCDSIPCRIEGLTYKCQCYSGFSGTFCQVNNSLQLEFQKHSFEFKSAGICIINDEGYNCQCSTTNPLICQCNFIKCPIHSICIKVNRAPASCTGSRGNESLWNISINFDVNELNNETLTSYFESTRPILYIKFYLFTIIIIPILITTIVVVNIIFRCQFNKTSKLCIKTIHNDLSLRNISISPNVQTPEQRIVVHGQTQLVTLLTEKWIRLNCLTAQKNNLKKKKMDISLVHSNYQYIDKSRSCDDNTLQRNILLNDVMTAFKENVDK